MIQVISNKDVTDFIFLRGGPGLQIEWAKYKGWVDRPIEPILQGLTLKLDEILQVALPQEGLIYEGNYIKDQVKGALGEYGQSTFEFHKDGGVALRAHLHISGPSIEYLDANGNMQRLQPGDILYFSGRYRYVSSSGKITKAKATTHRAPRSWDPRRLLEPSWRSRP